jgi:cation diffusion facilitator CzcD-associated flavoprotein CzcO
MDTPTDQPVASTPEKPDVDVLVIGGGFAGLCMAIRLRQAGFSFLLLERAAEIGGTWQVNTYPGCACDIPSQLYSFSFELNSDWSRTYPMQREILAYLHACANKYKISERILLNTEAKEACFEEARRLWRVRTGQGETITARAIISAMGPLSRPTLGRLPAAERFQGKAFHSSEWDHTYDFAGKKVAVIGTGASAIQIVPQLAPRVHSLCVFQRSPPWILPKFDVAHARWLIWMLQTAPVLKPLARSLLYWLQEAMGFALAHPAFMRPVERLARAYLVRAVADADLRRRLTPDYPMGCKRILLSNDYYAAFARNNLDLVTEPIKEISERGIVTKDGRERPFDAIIFATGFHGTERLAPLRVIGRSGADLGQAWSDGTESLLGVTVAGFPNFFMLVGPNTFLAHNSVVFMIEAQVNYVIRGLQWLTKSGNALMDLRSEVQEQFTRDLKKRMRGTIWTSGCNSWYLDERKENAALWPASPTRYWFLTRRFSPEHYTFSCEYGANATPSES